MCGVVTAASGTIVSWPTLRLQPSSFKESLAGPGIGCGVALLPWHTHSSCSGGTASCVGGGTASCVGSGTASCVGSGTASCVGGGTASCGDGGASCTALLPVCILIIFPNIFAAQFFQDFFSFTFFSLNFFSLNVYFAIEILF